MCTKQTAGHGHHSPEGKVVQVVVVVLNVYCTAQQLLQIEQPAAIIFTHWEKERQGVV